MNEPNSQQNQNCKGDDTTKPSSDQEALGIGIPEMPGNIASIETPVYVEYGYEQLKQLEKSAENELEAAERKEPNKLDDSSQQQIQAQIKKKQKPQPKEDTQQLPYFGYKIPPSIANDFKLIRKLKGRGDTSFSKTWILMLLDRLLKIRSVV